MVRGLSLGRFGSQDTSSPTHSKGMNELEQALITHSTVCASFQNNVTFHFLVQIKSLTDASNFDKYPRDVDIPPDELSGWDERF